ncbi:hypothetical protein [Alicyclobacillus fastidiosus]|uniref:Uncharacterized protein n=1 Tax=Alicyclobacillus fastidiosus TaxID=392011 RepID=A0ABV5AG71_9BACL|nr:hypothetical protein [Alicyclobacillus fastidiosus]WEH11792.1 hypothetical protein PYS47_11555 [Alicyclobacillus fastidiosus]
MRVHRHKNRPAADCRRYLNTAFTERARGKVMLCGAIALIAVSAIRSTTSQEHRRV